MSNDGLSIANDLNHKPKLASFFLNQHVIHRSLFENDVDSY